MHAYLCLLFESLRDEGVTSNDFGRDYVSVWCLIPCGGSAACLSVKGRLTELGSRARVCNERSAICDGTSMISSNNPPCPQS